MTDTNENETEKRAYDEILFSILMASSQKPDGLPKEDIMDILAAYDEIELYALCEAAELVDVEGEADDEDGSVSEALIDGLNV